MTRGQTPQLKKAFIEAFRVCGNVTTACQQTDIDRKAIYRWREKDPVFEEAFKAAEVESVEHLEKEARRRAVEGWDEPVYQGGAMVGVVRKFSDTLLIFLLKGNAPEKYRERQEVKHTGGVSVGDSLTIEEREGVRRYLTGAGGR